MLMVISVYFCLIALINVFHDFILNISFIQLSNIKYIGKD